MSGPNFLNLCYNSDAKREVKKKNREEARYQVLEGEGVSRKSDSALTESDEDSDSNPRRSNKKLAMFNKIFKIKAKNSDDEDGPSSVYELAEIKETAEAESSHPDGDFSKPEGIGMINRKKLRSALHELSSQPKKHPGWAKIRPAPDIPKKTSNEMTIVVKYTAAFSSETMVEEKPVMIQPVNQERVLKEFDPLWFGEDKTEDTDDSLQLIDLQNKPPIIMINDKIIEDDKSSDIELPDLKIAKFEALKNYELSVVEKVLEKPKNDKADELIDKENISYKSLENGHNRSVISDNFNNLKKLTDEEERANNKFIADFFSEHTRSFTDDDVDNFKANIAISKIEIYAEDIKRYHDSLKYHRGPVEHDHIYSLVETALKFIEEMVQKREMKKKGGFFPDFIEKCLKSKAKKEAEAKKKKEQKKLKDKLRPKLWLVFNPYQKEKVIICTPGDFYDSE